MSQDDAYRPFVPRRGRLMAWVSVILTIIVFALVAFVMVPGGGVTGWTMLDRWALFAFGLVIAWLLTRWALVRADVTPEGIHVRNLFVKRFVPWAEVVGVQFGGGRPWCLLDLSDTEQLAVMGIQRADGPISETEAARLAALVEVAHRDLPND